ncbi:MAG: type I restriction endonuclease subunit R, partial [Oscillospiraceae bacterium]|nr:type I restriction endonuclease subunit R [Oscillospiraceae bacterium]
MAKLKKYNGHFCESDYEYAFISFLEKEGWQYLAGDKMKRVYARDVLNTEDFEKFLSDTNPDLTTDEIRQISDRVRLVGAESDFATLHKVYNWLVDGIQFTPQNGQPRMISLIDFEEPTNNLFKVVNQLTVDYTDNGQLHNRRPDVLLYINGIPVCIIELKNPTDEKATIAKAWKQINIRYWRDIPNLLHYCPLACISDGVQTRLGTVRTPYEHFYAWRRVDDGDKISTLPFEETETMIKGVYSPERFLEIFRDYIYFQDSIYDKEEREIVCRYPQFFAARLLKKSIIESVQTKSGKGGT